MVWSNGDLRATFLELACEGWCRQAEFFLHLLYGVVGDSVRSDRVSSDVVDLVAVAGDSDDAGIRRFARRAGALLSDPGLFDYELWCEGGLSREIDPWP